MPRKRLNKPPSASWKRRPDTRLRRPQNLLPSLFLIPVGRDCPRSSRPRFVHVSHIGCVGMTNANMKLVVVSVLMDDKLETPASRLDEGEHIEKRVIPLDKLNAALNGTYTSHLVT